MIENRLTVNDHQSALFHSTEGYESNDIDSGTSVQAAPNDDAELLGACRDFREAHAKLDRLFAFDPDPSEDQLFLLHQRWSDACLKAASLAATTPEGRRAKAEMLLLVMDVVLGPNVGDRELHEVLAASVARDC